MQALTLSKSLVNGQIVMNKLAKTTLTISSIFFAVFVLNVSMGAFGQKPLLNDIQEMLSLFIAAILFAASVLQLEATEKN